LLTLLWPVAGGDSDQAFYLVTAFYHHYCTKGYFSKIFEKLLYTNVLPKYSVLFRNQHCFRG